MISGSWLYHFVFVNVCVLQCHQMTTLFGLDESPKALRNRRNVEMEITVPGLPQFPPVYLLSSSLPPSSILFHNQKWEKQTLADADHLCAQQVPCFGTIAGDTAADPSRSAFIWTAESPSVCSSEWIMHTSSPHPTHSHRFDSEQRRCFGDRRRGIVKKWGKERGGNEERASYKSHQCSLTTSTATGKY